MPKYNPFKDILNPIAAKKRKSKANSAKSKKVIAKNKAVNNTMRERLKAYKASPQQERKEPQKKEFRAKEIKRRANAKRAAALQAEKDSLLEQLQTTQREFKALKNKFVTINPQNAALDQQILDIRLVQLNNQIQVLNKKIQNHKPSSLLRQIWEDFVNTFRAFGGMEELTETTQRKNNIASEHANIKNIQAKIEATQKRAAQNQTKRTAENAQDIKEALGKSERIVSLTEQYTEVATALLQEKLIPYCKLKANNNLKQVAISLLELLETPTKDKRAAFKETIHDHLDYITGEDENTQNFIALFEEASEMYALDDLLPDTMSRKIDAERLKQKLDAFKPNTDNKNTSEFKK
ncbi:MAG: hypothetical protein QNK11_09745 [Legionella sp.]|nr:hypothetical protein [Legionella sp.]